MTPGSMFEVEELATFYSDVDCRGGGTIDWFVVEEGSLVLVLAGPFSALDRGLDHDSDNVVYLYLVNGRLAWDTADHWRGRQVVP